VTKPRKTIEMATVLDTANDMLRKSKDECVEGRHAVAVLLEGLLMATGNYKGFAFTDGNQGRTDESRRQYYRHHNLNG
jgi:hypothetical protein